jgi:hypothetical protein
MAKIFLMFVTNTLHCWSAAVVLLPVYRVTFRRPHSAPGKQVPGYAEGGRSDPDDASCFALFQIAR